MPKFLFFKRATIIAVGLFALWLLHFRFREQARSSFSTKISNRPSVLLRQGIYIGHEVKDVYPQILEQFLGIPYAQSTEGVRRFKPPIPVNESKLEFDASQYGNCCPAGGVGDIAQSEDCLNLNIFRPKNRDQDKKIPVLVHIHGGGFNFGTGSERHIAQMVAWAAKPMIGVSFNYRVGAFGFLPSKVMAKEGSLNLGLKDQVLLLKWVQENIIHFGGDPSKVTIMGPSAGAHSVGHHLLHDTDKPPLFSKAILESGAATARAVYSYHNPLHEQQFEEFLEILGCKGVPPERIMQTLRLLSTAEIKQASEDIFNKYNPSMRWPFQPVIDGKDGMISIRPIDAWKAGKWHKVPILTGFNTNEGALFVPSSASTSADFTDFFRTLLPSLWDADIEKLAELYSDPLKDPSSKYKETREGLGAQNRRLEQAYGHFAYVAPVRQTVHYAAAGPAPVYLYHFGASSSVDRGADHGTHSQFVTYSPEISGVSDTLNELSGMMHAYWTSFILTGDPNAVKGNFGERMKWPRYDLGKGSGRIDGRLLMFGEGNDEIAGGQSRGVVVQVKDDGWAELECDYWWKRTPLFEL